MANKSECLGSGMEVEFGVEDIFASSYRLRAKLGRGHCSSVWLAEHATKNHCRSTQLVVLKIPRVATTASFEGKDFEQSIARKDITSLRGGDNPDDYTAEQDAFSKLLLPEDIIGTGPLGYAALLFTGMCGPSVFEYSKGLPGGHLPWAMARRAITDAITALHFLHTRGVGHGDFHTRNLLLVPDLPMSSWDVTTTLLYTKARVPLLNILSPDLQETDLRPMLSFFEEHGTTFSGFIKLADFGSAFIAADGGRADSCWEIQAPERLQGRDWGLPADIWALGCTLLELVTGRHFFQPQNMLRDTWTPEVFLLLISHRLGADGMCSAHLRREV